MHAVVRRYTGVSSLIDEMIKKQPEVENVLRSVPGFSAYYALRDGDALTTVTVCDNEAGTARSTQVAAQWVKDNVPDLSTQPPTVSAGDVFIGFDVH